MPDIPEILASGNLQLLVGMEEDDRLEVKGEPYGLGTAAGRFELAKDVSAFANSSGGYLLLGPVTERRPDSAIDVVASLALIPATDFPVAQYKGVIDEYVYPRIEGLDVFWQNDLGSSDGIGVIRVPMQNLDSKPFVILKVVEGGETLRQIVLGYAERQGSANEPFNPKQVQQALRKGRDGVSVRLTRMEEALFDLLDRLPRGEQAGAVPVEPAEIRSRFDSDSLQKRIEGILEDPPQ